MIYQYNYEFAWTEIEICLFLVLSYYLDLLYSVHARCGEYILMEAGLVENENGFKTRSKILRACAKLMTLL